MNKETERNIRLRQEQLQSAARVYRGMLGMEVRDVGKKAAAVAELTTTGIVIGRLLMGLFRRKSS